jgi:hypothetical protein
MKMRFEKRAEGFEQIFALAASEGTFFREGKMPSRQPAGRRRYSRFS